MGVGILFKLPIRFISFVLRLFGQLSVQLFE